MIAVGVGIAFDGPEAHAPADFYAGISGWEKELSGGALAARAGPEGILPVFQTVAGYAPSRRGRGRPAPGGRWPISTGRQTI